MLRYDMIEGSTFEKNEGEEECLIQKVMEQRYQLGIDELTKLCHEINDNKELLLVRIKKDDKTAAEEMGYKYAYGDEANGIFINRKKAKEYFDKAGWDDMDCEEDTSMEWEVMRADYYLQGAPATLDSIRTMIEDLTRRYGTPYNEQGLFVPLETLM